MTLPVFETPRLTLQSITAHDAERLHGWIVVPSCWRQALMTAAAPPLISHCFTRLNVHRIPDGARRPPAGIINSR